VTDEVKFFIRCIPPKTTHQSAMRLVALKGHGVRAFKSQKGKQVENDLINLLAPHVPDKPFTGPVSLKVSWVWPWRKGDSKKVRAKKAIPYTSRPDLSNLVKMLEDCMTRLAYWNDDAQVAELEIRKALGDEPGIGIRIQTIDG
jgi:Holliday junction resolvase RusA-like endonuclease